MKYSAQLNGSGNRNCGIPSSLSSSDKWGCPARSANGNEGLSELCIGIKTRNCKIRGWLLAKPAKFYHSSYSGARSKTVTHVTYQSSSQTYGRAKCRCATQKLHRAMARMKIQGPESTQQKLHDPNQNIQNDGKLKSFRTSPISSECSVAHCDYVSAKDLSCGG